MLRFLKIGEFGLPCQVLEQVTILCFWRLIRQMMELDGGAADIWIEDAAAWFSRRLSKADADLVIAAMSHHVDSSVIVQDFTWVSQV